jgi:hypothetical protein
MVPPTERRGSGGGHILPPAWVCQGMHIAYMLITILAPWDSLVLAAAALATNVGYHDGR